MTTVLRDSENHDIRDGNSWRIIRRWEPREDSQLAELIGIMIIRMQGRLYDVHGWLYKMSGISFSLTLDLKSMPPPHTTGIPHNGRRRRRLRPTFEGESNKVLWISYDDVVHVSRHRPHDAEPKVVANRRTRPFNENLQVLEELNVEGESWAVLQSYQTLEKILYLMRVFMHQRPEYLESSTGTVDTLLALFPHQSGQYSCIRPAQRRSLGAKLLSTSLATSSAICDSRCYSALHVR
ncbi:hypothetical protein GQ600_18858 [Phytophthora cactorum]|nr:hypothetical protein GQ600_18858 [Phytophthora cactorum]